jgi:putative phosphoesterase
MPLFLGTAERRLQVEVGVISDTHGLLRPEAERALLGVDLILHAGDVGSPEILTRLRSIAPIFAVRGNVDSAPWAAELPRTIVVEFGGATFYLLHNLRDLDLKPEAAGIDAVISGHTHQVDQNLENGVLYLNPGSIGPRRFHLPITLARLRIDVQPWQVHIVRLLTNIPRDSPDTVHPL